MKKVRENSSCQEKNAKKLKWKEKYWREQT